MPTLTGLYTPEFLNNCSSCVSVAWPAVAYVLHESMLTLGRLNLVFGDQCSAVCVAYSSLLIMVNRSDKFIKLTIPRLVLYVT